jgi:1-acyl-sn-glycerol-3-phosphate acyltransferase
VPLAGSAAERDRDATRRVKSKKAVVKKTTSPPLWLRLASTAFWLFITFSSIALFPLAALIWLVTAPFDRRKVVLHRFTCLWASLYTWLNPAWPITIEGRENIRRGVPYVMVANHQSLLDILVLFRLFTHFKWVSKIENFRVPCIGWNMRLNRYIPLRRGDTRSIAEMMDTCAHTLEEGSPIMMFPEGTRSRDGRLRPFKHGAFTLAKRKNVPILPIVVEGTGNALPKAGLVLQGRHPIRIRILPELAPDSWPEGDVEKLTEHVRELFKRELGEE